MTTSSGSLLVLGGRSEIGVEVASGLVKQGYLSVILAARSSDRLGPEVQRLREDGADTVETLEFDADDLQSHQTVLDEAVRIAGPIGVVVVAFGILGSQTEAERSAEHAVSIVHTDYVAHVSVLTRIASLLRQQEQGTVVVFSSVAGVRVRRSNYVYGSAKAGLDGFATGLATALRGSGANLVLVRPGFVIGKMTSGMKPAPFASTPRQVGEATVKAVMDKRETVWVPRLLYPLFFTLKLLPQRLWRQLRM